MKLRYLLVLAVTLLLQGCSKPQPFTLTDITGADFAQGFALTDHTGKARTLKDYQGKAVWLFFGFTHCPDVCPTMMSQLALAHRKMGEDAARVQVLFVTLDPERDSADILRQYVPAFNPSFVGLLGTPQQIKATADSYKVFYEKTKTDNPQFYTLNHASQVFVYDPQGRVRLFYTPSTSIDALVADTRRLLHE